MNSDTPLLYYYKCTGRSEPFLIKMKIILIILCLFIVSLPLAASDKLSFFKSIRSIVIYDAVGHMETINGELTGRPPLILPEAGSMYIYPYDVFIRIFDRFTGNEYFTRNLLQLHGHFSWNDYASNNMRFVPGIDDRLSISLNDYSKANFIFIEQRQNDFYFIVAYRQCSCEGLFFSCDIIDFEYLLIIDEVRIDFYRPVGRIETLSNIFFNFEEAEQRQGTIVFDYVNLSNIDIIKHLAVIKTFIETSDFGFLNLSHDREYYLELLSEAVRRVESRDVSRPFVSWLDPFGIRSLLWGILFCNCGNIRSLANECYNFFYKKYL